MAPPTHYLCCRWGHHMCRQMEGEHLQGKALSSGLALSTQRPYSRASSSPPPAQACTLHSSDCLPFRGSRSLANDCLKLMDAPRNLETKGMLGMPSLHSPHLAPTPPYLFHFASHASPSLCFPAAGAALACLTSGMETKGIPMAWPG